MTFAARFVLKALDRLSVGRLTMRLPDGSARVFGGDGVGRAGRPRGQGLAFLPPRPARRRYRLRRSLHGRLLRFARPAGADRPARREREGAGPRGPHQPVPRPAAEAAAPATGQFARGLEEEHPRPLRPRQRVLRPVARSHDDLLLGAVRRRAEQAARSRADRQVRAHPRPDRRQAGRQHPRDRLRLGRLRRDRGAARHARHRHHDLAASSSSSRARAWSAPAWPTASTCSSATIATSKGATTISCRSRWSRRWASATGRTTSPR